MLLKKLLTLLAKVPGGLGLWTKLGAGNVELRTTFGAWERPHYAYGVLSAAQLAKKLGLPAVSVVELGVAGGNGLVFLESIASQVSSHLGIKITVIGFDAGSGMPPPVDYRDLPHVWDTGFYRMDEAALRARLRNAILLLGNVKETIPTFLSRTDLPPIGFISFDLDYYSSTVDALKLFDGPQRTRLPRVQCYLDDVIWPEYACHNEFTGELLAIKEFNSSHESFKICRHHLLRHMRRVPKPWNDQMYIAHDFLHPQYCVNITDVGNQFREIHLKPE